MEDVMRITPTPLVVALLAAPAALTGCAPAFHDARMVGPGRVEVTPSVTAFASPGSGGSRDETARGAGVQAVVGLSDRVDLGVGYTRVSIASEHDATNFVGGGPKFSLRKDRLALAVPVTFAWEDGRGILSYLTLTAHPALVMTRPLSDRVDLNTAIVGVVPFAAGAGTALGGSIGLGIRPASAPIVFRPDVRVLVSPWAGQRVSVSAGLGVSLRN
jgi:hypothetical protein